MTNEQTALANVIEDVINLDQSLNPQSYEATYMHIAYNKVIDLIKHHLPYEREQMEKCYKDGIYYASHTKDAIYNDVTDIVNSIDYFNKNYTQDGK